MWKSDFGNILKGTKMAVMEQENFEYKDQKIIDVHMEKEVKNSLFFILISVSFWFMAYNAVNTAYSRYVQEVWGKSQSTGATMMIIAMLVATAAYLPEAFKN